MTDRIVIVGGGLAAATAATELRKRGFSGSIRLLAAEPHPPYIRPPLSKGYLQGSEERSAAFVHPDDWYGENDVQLTTSARVESIDRAGRTVTLADGEVVPYDRLLLATGAEPRRLSIPGADAGGIHYLRTSRTARSFGMPWRPDRSGSRSSEPAGSGSRSPRPPAATATTSW